MHEPHSATLLALEKARGNQGVVAPTIACMGSRMSHANDHEKSVADGPKNGNCTDRCVDKKSDPSGSRDVTRLGAAAGKETAGAGLEEFGIIGEGLELTDAYPRADAPVKLLELAGAVMQAELAKPRADLPVALFVEYPKDMFLVPIFGYLLGDASHGAFPRGG